MQLFARGLFKEDHKEHETIPRMWQRQHVLKTSNEPFVLVGQEGLGEFSNDALLSPSDLFGHIHNDAFCWNRSLSRPDVVQSLGVVSDEVFVDFFEEVTDSGIHFVNMVPRKRFVA